MSTYKPSYISKSNVWILNRSSRSRRSLAIQAILMFALFILCSAILTSCSTGATIRDIPLSYNAIKTVVVANIPQGVRRESPNGRELTSNFFEVKDFKPEKSDSSERAYALVKILGSSRPYNVDVKVFREEKRKGVWRADGTDSELTEQLGERMK
ncbi:MAG: hypothetical protein EOP05_05170, partial [Proteobacteria bacterium]